MLPKLITPARGGSSSVSRTDGHTPPSVNLTRGYSISDGKQERHVSDGCHGIDEWERLIDKHDSEAVRLKKLVGIVGLPLISVRPRRQGMVLDVANGLEKFHRRVTIKHVARVANLIKTLQVRWQLHALLD